MTDKELLEYQLNGIPGQKKSGFEVDPDIPKPCFHQEHRPPTGMVIPPGLRYRHVCPGCGTEVVIRSVRVTC